MRSSFPLYQSHLDLAHIYWSQLIQVGDTVIDATCGKGQDTLKVCQLALATDKGKVYAFDIQEQAISITHHSLQSHLSPLIRQRVILQQRCHSSFPSEIVPASVKLIVYNLGYLPGGEKACTTRTATTLESLQQAQILLQAGGVISMTCYSGHKEGVQEQEAVLAYVACLSPKEWSCCQHLWLNRHQAPSLLLIQKASYPEN